MLAKHKGLRSLNEIISYVHASVTHKWCSLSNDVISIALAFVGIVIVIWNVDRVACLTCYWFLHDNVIVA